MGSGAISDIADSGVPAAFAWLTEDAIDPSALLARVAAPGNGGIVLFLGTVRDSNQGRAVAALDYSAYRPMAERVMRDILLEAFREFGVAHLGVVHRIGTLQIGDTSVAIVVGHARRDQAYLASRYVLEELKARVPVWKREHYADGTRVWVNQMDEPVGDVSG